MTKQISMAVAALMILGTASVAQAMRSMVKVENDDVTFKVFRINDGERYEVTYYVDGVRSHITIDDEMELQRFVVGDETYPITYEPWTFPHTGTYPAITAPVGTPFESRLASGGGQTVPWACGDCEDTYDFLCSAPDNGYSTSLLDKACSKGNLRDPDNMLSETATKSLATFCNSFPCEADAPPYAYDVCEGQCESEVLE